MKSCTLVFFNILTIFAFLGAFFVPLNTFLGNAPSLRFACTHSACVASPITTATMASSATASTEAATAAEQPNFTNLIVFARFDGEAEFINEIYNGVSVKQLIDDSYSNADYSVRDYYYRVSNGNVNMQNVYLLDSSDGSLELSRNRGYYYAKADGNAGGYEESEYNLRVSQLQQDWASAVTTALTTGGGSISSIDGSQTFTVDDLDKNGDGKIDSITVIYKYSTEFSAGWKSCLWNYQTYTDRVSLTSPSGKTVTSFAYVQMTYDYSYSYLNEGGSKRFANMKTMIHEMGHIFGLKDLYNTSSQSPVYYMSAMANALSPVPQFISAKERESLGWLGASNVQQITTAGQYTVNVTSSEIGNGVVAFKCKLQSKNKTLYLEYRKFDGATNKYDTQAKRISSSTIGLMPTITIKSGLVCFLVDSDTTFPSNMYGSSGYWSYEVLGGQNATKNDSALAADESLTITSALSVEVVSVDEDKLTFKVVGTDIAQTQTHTHNLDKVNAKAASCTEAGYIEHYKCSSCGKLFLESGAEVSAADIAVEAVGHLPVTVSGKTPTCQETGLSDGSKCNTCGEILVPQTTLNKLAHVESDWIIEKPATTSEAGSKYKKCTNCGTRMQTQPIPKLDNTSGGSGSGSGTGDGDKDDNAGGETDDGNTGGDKGDEGAGDPSGDETTPPVTANQSSGLTLTQIVIITTSSGVLILVVALIIVSRIKATKHRRTHRRYYDS